MAVNSQSSELREMREAIEAVTRFATKGCAGTACDRLRGAWMGNQLAIIGKAAAAMPDEVRNAYSNIPWDRLSALAGEQQGVAGMTPDDMQRFVERELPGVKQSLAREQRRHP